MLEGVEEPTKEGNDRSMFPHLRCPLRAQGKNRSPRVLLLATPTPVPLPAPAVLPAPLSLWGLAPQRARFYSLESQVQVGAIPEWSS